MKRAGHKLHPGTDAKEKPPNRSVKGDLCDIFEDGDICRLLFEKSADAMLVLHDGCFVECNPAAVALFEADSKEDILGRRPRDFSFPLTQLNGTLSREKTGHMEFETFRKESHAFEWLIGTKTGAALLVEVKLTPVTTAGKEIVFVVLRDITSRRMKDRQLESLSANIPGMLFQVRTALGGGAEIVSFGGEIPSLFGYGAKDFPIDLNDCLWGVHPGDLPKIKSSAREAAEKKSHWRCESRLVLPNGEILWVEGSAFPTEEPGGGVLWHGYLANVTARKNLEEQVKDQLSLQEQIFTTLPVPLVLKDRNSRFLQVNEAFADFVNIPRNEIIGKGPYEVFSPELAELVFQEDRDILRTGETKMDLERRVRDGHGRFIWLKSYKGPIVSNHGEIVGIVGGNMDITAVKAAEEALRESEARWKFALEGAGDGVWDWNLAKGEIYFSRQWKAMLGYEDEEIPNRRIEWKRLIHPDDQEKAFASLKRYFRGESPLYTCEIRMKSKQGEWRWFLDRGKVVERDEQGRPLRLIGIQTDITSRKQAESLIFHQATHDMLTDLPNRALFNDRLTLAMAEARRYEKKVGVIFLDLDNFKKVNDMLGHGAGDYLLVQVAERIRRVLRETDTAARVGGDEFTFFLPLVDDARQMEQAAMRILLVLADPFVVEGAAFQISGSMGIAIFPEDGEDAHTLVKRADMAMYEAKRAGKNTWKFWAGSSGVSLA